MKNMQLLRTRIISLALPVLLCLAGIEGYSGDTVFTAIPDTRNIDTSWMHTVFFDGFGGDSLNTDIWVADDASRGAGDNENNPLNIQVRSGILRLIARSSPGKVDTTWDNRIYTRNYTTAEIWTRWHRYLYGSFEARCKMPEGKGLWFAYWIHGPGGDGYPEDHYGSEIDIAEADCDQLPVKLIHALHYWLPDHTEMKIDDRKKGYEQYMNDWHIFRLIWTPFEVAFFIDGIKKWERTRFSMAGIPDILNDYQVFDVPRNMIRLNTKYNIHEWFPRHHMATVLQMAVDSTVAGNENLLPAVMEVDYVKIRQFFTAPVINSPDTIFTASTATLNTDSQADKITWTLTPSGLFKGLVTGTGKSASVEPANGTNAEGKITYTFHMPSGEVFSKEKKIYVRNQTVSTDLIRTVPADCQLSIIPNPATASIEIKLQPGDGLTFSKPCRGVIANGFRQVMQQISDLGDGSWRIDVSGWPSGIYYVRFDLREGIVSGKFAVVR